MTDSTVSPVGIALHARNTPGKPALILGERTLTYLELDERAARLASGLAKLGLGPGERVAAMLPNGFEFFETGAAAARLGSNFIPVNWHLKAAEVRWILTDSSARVLVAHHDFAEEAITATQGLESCTVVWVGPPVAGKENYEELIEEADPLSTLPQGVASTPYMFYTSGTSGKPKGAIADPAGGSRQSLNLIESFGLRSDDVHLLAGPAYHAAPGGWTNIYLALGATTVILPKWDAGQWLSLVELHKVTTVFVVPTHFARIFEVLDEDDRRWDISTIRLILHAAEPCRVSLKHRAIAEFPQAEILEYYGGSEAGAATYITKDEWIRHPGSVGRPMDGISVRILDGSGAELPSGQDGIIYYTPGGNTRYHNDPEKTAKGWCGDVFTVGDLGRVDEDGYLYISDRRDDLILRGGVNVYPREVEDALMEHPSVVDCVVVGVSDNRYGQMIKAIVQVRRSVSAEELKDFCLGRLAKFKCPQIVDFIDELPRDPSGKIRRRQFREG